MKTEYKAVIVRYSDEFTEQFVDITNYQEDDDGNIEFDTENKCYLNEQISTVKEHIELRPPAKVIAFKSKV